VRERGVLEDHACSSKSQVQQTLMKETIPGPGHSFVTDAPVKGVYIQP
jgi:hypothetical protein